jgi:lambda repressor-like predicted transcriptional regulator
MRPKEQRLSYAGLVRWLQHRYDLEHTGYRTIAKTIGMTTNTVFMWDKTGVPLWTADKLAVKLGAHPADIWPEEWWNR